MDKKQKPFFVKIGQALEEVLAVELEKIRSELIRLTMVPQVSLLEFMESVIAYWKDSLCVDRIFVCDMRDGSIIAGWKRGKNIIRLADWDDRYVPLENDEILQKALESDELVAAPVKGEGADLAFSVHFDRGAVWLVVLDETDTARRFSPLDMAYIGVVRDLLLLKGNFVNPNETA